MNQLIVFYVCQSYTLDLKVKDSAVHFLKLEFYETILYFIQDLRSINIR